MALYLVLAKKKKRNVFLLSGGKYFETVWSYENDFHEIIILFNELG